MTYLLIKENDKSGYEVFDSSTLKILKRFENLDEANVFCWRNRDTERRYQILAKSRTIYEELTWYEQFGSVIIPNGFSSFEAARQAIIQDVKEICFLADYDIHPNPRGSYYIIDTFIAKNIPYVISYQEASHPDPCFQ